MLADCNWRWKHTPDDRDPVRLLRDRVERHLKERSLAPPDPSAADALELLAWMMAHGCLDVKVAVPCDAERRPIPADGIFHEKAGIVTDRAGDRIAWNGSKPRDRVGYALRRCAGT